MHTGPATCARCHAPMRVLNYGMTYHCDTCRVRVARDDDQPHLIRSRRGNAVRLAVAGILAAAAGQR